MYKDKVPPDKVLTPEEMSRYIAKLLIPIIIKDSYQMLREFQKRRVRFVNYKIHRR